MDDADPTVPDHLRTLLGDAAEHELESATDGHWPDGDDERIAHRDAITATYRMVENWAASACTAQEVARLAERAAEDQQPADFIGEWPTTIEQADELTRRVSLARELLQLRDSMGSA